ncbi:MAG: Appr-1-p processing protein [Kofleriaceae bacterium]|nr:Appr-1-p processing protein [Kofleriaceae bacterium]
MPKRQSSRRCDATERASVARAVPRSHASRERARARLAIVKLVEGDLLDQPVEAIVNAWNRNIIPWWLLIPQGVSGAIKRRGGRAPFREVARHGAIPLGGAVATGAGALPFKCIIHVAGIDMLWRASERSIRDSVTSALRVARERGIRSLAMPLIGAGSGGFDEDKVLAIIEDALRGEPDDIDVTVVRFRRARA